MFKEGLIFTLILIAIDYIWIGILMKNFYVMELGNMARIKNGIFTPNIVAVLFVYIAIFALVSIFLLPQISGLGIIKSALIALVFGLGIYAVYDFTNLAVLSSWSLRFVFVDVLWGGVLMAIVTVITKYFRLIS